MTMVSKMSLTIREKMAKMFIESVTYHNYDESHAAEFECILKDICRRYGALPEVQPLPYGY